MNSFKCALCGKVYEKAWNEEEAEAELKENFPDFKKEDCDVICDDCFKSGVTIWG